MDNCTRYQFTDGDCRKVPDGCLGCPGKFQEVDLRINAAQSNERGHRLAIAVLLGVGLLFFCFALGLAVIDGMQRAEDAYQADLRR